MAPLRFFTDYDGVVKGWTAGRAACLHEKHAHLEIWRDIWRLVDDIGADQIDVVKVRAHQSLEDLEGEELCSRAV